MAEIKIQYQAAENIAKVEMISAELAFIHELCKKSSLQFKDENQKDLCQVNEKQTKVTYNESENYGQIIFLEKVGTEIIIKKVVIQGEIISPEEYFKFKEKTEEKIEQQPYFPLHLHTEYSIGDAYNSVKEIAKTLKEKGFEGAAVTDHGTLAGTIYFQKALLEQGLKPIIGLEAYASLPNYPKEKYHLCIFVKDEAGWKSILALQQISNNNFNSKPILPFQDLFNHKEGLIISTACTSGILCKFIISNQIDKADALVRILLDNFGEDFYIELMPNRLETQKLCNKVLIDLAEKYNIKTIITTDVHYSKHEHKKIHDAVKAIAYAKKFGEAGFGDDTFYIQTSEEIHNLMQFQDISYQKVEECFKNTKSLAGKCNYLIKRFDEDTLPVLSQEPDTEIKNLVLSGLKTRTKYSYDDPKIKERIDLELGRIEKKGYSNYFLIVNEMIQWALSKDILTGVGRGCITGDTKISLLDGTEKTIEELTEKYKDEEFWVYSCTPEGEIVRGKGRNPRITKISEEICIVTLDNQEKIRCTLDHKFMMRDGSYKEAKDLKDRDSLMPLYRKLSGESEQIKGYELFLNNKKNKYEFTHRIGAPWKSTIHHINFSKRDNRPENLSSMTNKEHRDLHVKVNSERWKIPEFREKMTKIFIENGKKQFNGGEKHIEISKLGGQAGYQAGLKNWVELGGLAERNKSEEQRRKTSEGKKKYFKDNPEEAKKATAKLNTPEMLEKRRAMLIERNKSQKQKDAVSKRNSDPEFIKKCSEGRKEYFKTEKGVEEKKEISKRMEGKFNHKVESITIEKCQVPVYDIEVDDYHNFALTAGVFVHNSVGGSLSAYAMGITMADPIEYNLLFERFISEIRKDMPDVDMDFQDDRRHEVVTHLEELYGKENVAKIATYSTWHGKGALRDIGRIFNIPIMEIEKVSKMVVTRSGGDARCLTGDTLIWTENGKIPIKDLIGKTPKLGGHSFSKGAHKTFAQEIFSTGIQDVYEVITEKGNLIKTTANHRFMAAKGKKYSKGKVLGEWQKLENLQEGDSILCVENKEYYRTCQNCGKQIFYPSTKPKKFCSQNCTTSYRNKTNNPMKNPISKQKMIEKKTGGKVWNEGLTKENAIENFISELLIWLKKLKQSHCYYDKIIEIKYIGKEETYDLTVTSPKNKSFIANGFVVHNSSFCLQDTFEEFDQGKEFYAKYPEQCEIAKALEGHIRHAGIHAAGVALTKFPIATHVPLVRIGGIDATAWEKNQIEDLNIVKFDILGLKTFTLIQDTLKLIGKDRNILPKEKFDDLKVYNATFKIGECSGVFQFETTGLKKLSKQLAIKEFNSVIHATSLYRPGPLHSGITAEFVLRSNGKVPIKYVHPILEPITKETMGEIIYQEQVMQIMYDLGKFSWATSEAIRKIMSKSKGKEMFSKFRDEFCQNALREYKLPIDESGKIFDDVCMFGSYGFNKSHAMEYALISYWTAWLKTYYPTEFMCVLLSKEQDRISDYIADCKRLGIVVDTPDINRSEEDFTVKDNKIIAGMSTIKGLPSTTIKKISSHKPYKSFKEFIDKVKPNPGVLNSLVRSGSLDCFKINWKLAETGKEIPQKSLFDFGDDAPIPLQDYTEDEKLMFKISLTNMVVGKHPIETFALPIDVPVTKIGDLKFVEYVNNLWIKGVVTFINFKQEGLEGQWTMFDNVLERRYAHLNVGDGTENVLVHLAPEQYTYYKKYLESGVGFPVLLYGHTIPNFNKFYCDAMIVLNKIDLNNPVIKYAKTGRKDEILRAKIQYPWAKVDVINSVSYKVSKNKKPYARITMTEDSGMIFKLDSQIFISGEILVYEKQEGKPFINIIDRR